MTTVTVQDLKDWTMENEEDVVFDGPYDYGMEEYDELTLTYSDKLVERFGPTAKLNELEDIFNWGLDLGEGVIPVPNGYTQEIGYDILLECFSDLINKHNLKMMW